MAWSKANRFLLIKKSNRRFYWLPFDGIWNIKTAGFWKAANRMVSAYRWNFVFKAPAKSWNKNVSVTKICRLWSSFTTYLPSRFVLIPYICDEDWHWQVKISNPTSSPDWQTLFTDFLFSLTNCGFFFDPKSWSFRFL